MSLISHESVAIRHRLRLCAGLALILGGAAASASVPPTERAVLDAIWYGTGGQLPGGTGSTWTNRGGWGIPPVLGISECGSYGVTCVVVQGQEHVAGIALGGNGLTGTLPSSLSALPYLETFDVSDNDIGGSMPTLTGLTKLQVFDIGHNQLTGSIPALMGLTNLETFAVYVNQLTGSIPSLAGLTKLKYFGISYNLLSGGIPSLDTLSQLQSFDASVNQLTGTIPPLSGLTNLQSFSVEYNQLTGSIPTLSGLTQLQYFDVGQNRLSGPIPPLTNVPNLFVFYVYDNLLTGTIPAAPPSLGMAWLCPNRLTIVSQPTIDPAWNAATNTTPWWATPTPTSRCDELYYDGFDPIPD